MATLQYVRDEARAAVVEGDYEGALFLVALIRRHFPGDFQTLGLLGQVCLGSGRRTDARESFTGVLEVDPENVVARAGLAILAEEESDLDQALEQFERAFDLDSSNHQVAREISRLHSQLNHTRPVNPGSSLHALARRFLRGKRYSQAIPLFEDALVRSQGVVEVAIGLAQSLWIARRREEAERLAGEILGKHPICLKPLAVLAGAAFARGEGEALALLERTAELDPGNVVARRLFVAAGLPFPRVGEEPEIPEGPLREGLGVAWRVRSLGGVETDPEAPVEEFESDEVADDEIEPFIVPEAELEGEWVRGKGQNLSAFQEGDPAYWRAFWSAGDALAAEGQFRRAVEQYLIVLHGSRRVTLWSGEAGEGERIEVEKEQDGTNSGYRQA